jgi:uncharacterized membrane protein YfcA
MVPFLYLVYAGTGVSLSAQTVVAHATSLGVAFVAASFGTWRYSKADAIAWRAALAYALPGIASAFLTARLLTQATEVEWLRAAFGTFLIISGADMARRARAGAAPEPGNLTPHSLGWLAVIGIVGGAASAALGIGGGLIAVPVLLYVGQLPVRSIPPTALAGVWLTTLAGGIGYLTAGHGPEVSTWMAGYVDGRMAVPLSLGALCTVPLGVRVNRRVAPPTLYWSFAALFLILGAMLLRGWVSGSAR